MASYKYGAYLGQNDGQAFDTLHQPGQAAPNAGIYRCEVCGHEIGIAYGHILPPQSHSQHPPGQQIQWRLIVFAVHNS
jgi:hypothetical protein